MQVQFTQDNGAIYFHHFERPAMPLTGLLNMRADDAAELCKVMEPLKEREVIVIMHRLDGWTYESIARNYKVKRERIRQLWVKGVRHAQMAAIRLQLTLHKNPIYPW